MNALSLNLAGVEVGVPGLAIVGVLAGEFEFLFGSILGRFVAAPGQRPHEQWSRQAEGEGREGTGGVHQGGLQGARNLSWHDVRVLLPNVDLRWATPPGVSLLVLGRF